jgi:hypothetical protein
VQIVDAEGKCKHRNNPAHCPTLREPIAAIQQVLKQSTRSVQ